MEPIKRTIRINKPDEYLTISGGSEHESISVRHFEQIKIVSIKTKGIDPTDFILQIFFKDSWGHRKGKEKSFYFGEFGQNFINQNDFLVLYPNNGEGLIINKPEHAEDVILNLMLFNKSVDLSHFECFLNIVFSDSPLISDFI